jgi:hypothetical protein
VNIDNSVDEREKEAIQDLQIQEEIPDALIHAFKDAVLTKSERELFQYGVYLLNLCNDQEKLCALAHLYHLAEQESKTHIKEVRWLLYSLKDSEIDFEDIEMTARLVKASKNPSHATGH